MAKIDVRDYFYLCLLKLQVLRFSVLYFHNYKCNYVIDVDTNNINSELGLDPKRIINSLPRDLCALKLYHCVYVTSIIHLQVITTYV